MLNWTAFELGPTSKMTNELMWDSETKIDNFHTFEQTIIVDKMTKIISNADDLISFSSLLISLVLLFSFILILILSLVSLETSTYGLSFFFSFFFFDYYFFFHSIPFHSLDSIRFRIILVAFVCCLRRSFSSPSSPSKITPHWNQFGRFPSPSTTLLLSSVCCCCGLFVDVFFFSCCFWWWRWCSVSLGTNRFNVVVDFSDCWLLLWYRLQRQH